MELFVNIIGWIGAVEVVIAYALNSNGTLKSDSYLFQILNLTGAIFLIVRTWVDHSWPSMVINIVWTAVAIIALVKIARRK